MSINHLIGFTGQDLNIGASKFKATNSIKKFDTKALVSVKTDNSLSSAIPRLVVYGNITNSSGGLTGTVPNMFTWTWDANFNSGRCRINLDPAQPYAFSTNNPPVIMVSSLNQPPSYDATLGGFCSSYAIYDSFNIDIWMAATALQNHCFGIIMLL